MTGGEHAGSEMVGDQRRYATHRGLVDVPTSLNALVESEREHKRAGARYSLLSLNTKEPRADTETNQSTKKRKRERDGGGEQGRERKRERE